MNTMPPVHPAAEILPLMSDEEIADLANDIKQRGQRIPILMTDGAILDGRNRWRACELAGVEPVTEEWDKKGDPMEVSESLNSKRRHYKPGQLAAIAAGKVAYYEVQAKARIVEGARKGGQAKPGDDSSPPLPERDESARSIAKAAKAEGAGIEATKIMHSIKEKAPDVFDLARDGKVNVQEAKRLAALSKPERETAKTKIKEKAKAPATRTPRPRTQAPQPSETPEQRRVLEALRDAMTIETERRVGTYYFSLERESRLLRSILPSLFGRWPDEHHEELNQIIKEGHQ